MANSLQHIEHIVVLMQENRSFDNILGWQFGLDPKLFNETDDGKKIEVWNDKGTDHETMTIPNPDPGESFLSMNYQLFGSYTPSPNDTPNMGGFVRNYNNQSVSTGELYNERNIMHCFEPSQVPVTSELAKKFGVSDRWHASAPCQTWPNRFFVHCATADGWVNNLPQKKLDVVHRLPYDMPTIFNQVQGKGFDKGLFANRWKARNLELAKKALDRPPINSQPDELPPSMMPWRQRQTILNGKDPLFCERCLSLAIIP